MTPVEIDLRRDLPKVRDQITKVKAANGAFACEYAGPCVVGAMVPPTKRAALDCAKTYEGNSAILTLINEGFVDAPFEQRRDLALLQKAFDKGPENWSGFLRTLRRVEKKYLPAQGMSAGTAETAQQAQGEARQPGAEGMRPNPTSIIGEQTS